MFEPFTWTCINQDLILDLLLEPQTKNQFERQLVSVAIAFEIGEYDKKGVRDGDPIRRYFWGMAVRDIEYRGAVRYRADRRGKDWSWLELKILKWAFNKKRPKQTVGKDKPTDEYIALLLRRTEEEIKIKRGLLIPKCSGFGVL